MRKPEDNDGIWLTVASDRASRRVPNVRMPYLAECYIDARGALNLMFYGGRWQFAKRAKPGRIIQFAHNRFEGDLLVRQTLRVAVMAGRGRIKLIDKDEVKPLLLDERKMNGVVYAKSTDNDNLPEGVDVRPYSIQVPSGWKESHRRRIRRR